MKNRYATLGVLAVLLSGSTIVVMAALRTDGYSHLHQAVSELGSLDAPHNAVFNLLGYGLPGLLIAGFVYGLKRQAFAGARLWPFVLLAGSGLFMTLAGVFPMDMENRTTPMSLLHTVGSLGSGLSWLVGGAALPSVLRTHPAWAGLTKPLIWLLWVAGISTVLIPLLSPTTPALGQRVSFACYFLFILLLSGPVLTRR